MKEFTSEQKLNFLHGTLIGMCIRHPELKDDVASTIEMLNLDQYLPDDSPYRGIHKKWLKETPTHASKKD